MLSLLHESRMHRSKKALVTQSFLAFHLNVSRRQIVFLVSLHRVQTDKSSKRQNLSICWTLHFIPLTTTGNISKLIKIQSNYSHSFCVWYLEFVSFNRSFIHSFSWVIQPTIHPNEIQNELQFNICKLTNTFILNM